jgi:hypothetical protein
MLVVSNPTGVTVRVDGRPRGITPLQLEDLSHGPHRFLAELDGYLPADTTLEVSAAGGELRLTLSPEPPGYLVMMGNSIAVMFVDGRLVMSNTYNSGHQQLESGWHEIRVRLSSGTEFQDSVLVKSNEVVTYDYSLRRETERKPTDGSW